jgi:hypothetical protein
VLTDIDARDLAWGRRSTSDHLSFQSEQRRLSPAFTSQAQLRSMAVLSLFDANETKVDQFILHNLLKYHTVE